MAPAPAGRAPSRRPRRSRRLRHRSHRPRRGLPPRPGSVRPRRPAPGPPGPDATMACVSDDDAVTDNQAESRFEIRSGGYLAELLYRRHRDRRALSHTQGLGGRLVTVAVDRAAREGLTIVPYCPFARGWLERHPDVAGRVTIDWRAV